MLVLFRNVPSNYDSFQWRRLRTSVRSTDEVSFLQTSQCPLQQKFHAQGYYLKAELVANLSLTSTPCLDGLAFLVSNSTCSDYQSGPYQSLCTSSRYMPDLFRRNHEVSHQRLYQSADLCQFIRTASSRLRAYFTLQFGPSSDCFDPNSSSIYYLSLT